MAHVTATTELQSKERKRCISKEDRYLKRYLKELEYDRDTILSDWKKEFDQVDLEADMETKGICDSLCKNCADPCIEYLLRLLSSLEVFISNMPNTVAAVGLSWVTQGKLEWRTLHVGRTRSLRILPHVLTPQALFGSNSWKRT